MHEDYNVIVNIGDREAFDELVAAYTFKYFFETCPKELQLPVLNGLIEKLKNEKKD